MYKYDPKMGNTHQTGTFDIVHIFACEKFASGDTCKARNEYDTECKDHVVFAGTQQRDKYQRQQDSRKGNNDIVYAHQDFVNPSAKIPGERTDEDTNGSAEQQSSESDEEGCTGSF